MLKALIQQISSNTSATPPQQEQVSEVIEYLVSLQKNQQRLSVTVSQQARRYESFIIDINRAAGIVTLDALFPAFNGSLSGQPITLQSIEDGYETCFSSQVITTTHLSGHPALLVAFPDSIDTQQRRQFFRLAIPSTQPLSILLERNYYSRMTGSVKDISRRGIKLVVHGNTLDSHQINSRLSDCIVKLEQGQTITCSLTIMNRQYRAQPYRHTLLGCEITDIDYSHQKQLDHYISSQQRLQRRLASSLS